MLLNILDYVANNFYMEFILRHGLIDFLFNGVAFISNMERVLMGEIAFTSGDLNDSYNNVKAEDWLKSESNFKIIMMEYIGNDYYHFNNVSEAHIFNINNLTQFISMVFISIESFLLGFQKISYEIFGYVFDLCNWYINYKILLDKTIITSNLVEDYCYNISLELLAEVQSENIKLLWLLSENGDLRLKNSLYINLLKNYYQILKENPYKLNFELMRLYKSHLKLNILSYGMDFDINVVKSKKYFLSFFDLNVSNYGKLNTLNISYDAFDSYKISNYKIIDKTQKYYKNMMLSTDIETSIFAKKIINVDDKYNAIILNRFKESHLWFTQKNFIFFQTQSQINKPEWYTMFGGYSYWWGWHQDAVYIHGKKGPGGAPLWDDYIRWKISKKYKLFITYVPKHIKKIKHGVRLYNYYPGRITKRFTMFHFDWDYKKKKKFIKYIVHGRRVWEIERLFFKRFIWSSDIWLKVLNGQGGGNPAYYWENIESSTIREKFMYELERSGVVGVYDKVHYVKFGTNSPECVFKNKSSKFRSHYWWFAYMDNDREVTRHIKWKKSKMYEHIFSVLEHYYNLSLKMHDESMAGIRGFILKQFALDFWFAKDKLMLMNYLNDNQITWETFYTNIESVTEPLNLNYINKNFYGRHLTNKMDIFLVKHADIPTDVQLPKSTNLLLKKAYIENLIYVYQKEDEPMVNYIKYRTIPTDLYIWFRCKLDWAYIVLLRVIDAYLDLLGFIGEDITKSLMKIKQYRLLKEYHNTYKDNYKYALILFICVLYSIVCGVLMTLVRSFLPKNLVYGIRTYTKSNWKTAIRDFFESINNIVGWDNHRKYHGYIEATLVHLDKISKLLNIKDTAEREDSYKKDFNAEDKLKWRKTKLFLNKTESEVENNTNVLNWAAIEERTLNKINEESLYLRKNFFDAEQRYIYSWEKRFDKTYEDKVEDSTLERRYQFDWVPERAYSNIDKKKNELIQRNYAIFYKKLISEINLEKWENNTKIRADILLWAKYLGVSAYGLIRGLFLYYRDRRFNHNRIILWDDPLLEKESKVTYYFKVPKLFFNFFFIIKFTIGAIQLWDWNFWVRRWTQFVLYGVHARVSYKNLRKHLEKEWTLEWYKESADYGAGLFYKDYSKVVKKFQDIKNTPDDRRGFVYENKRADMISKILNLTFEDSKYDEMLAYRLTMLNIQESRKINSFDHKFKDIRIKLVLDVGKLTPKQWAEQKIMYKYVDEVYEKKLALEKEEYSDIKQSYTSRTYRDMEDEEKTLVFLEWEHQKHVQSIMKSKLSSVAYEKKLREFNYENKIVDAALDRKERVFFESIPEYKQDLQKEYNKIAEKEELQKAEDSAYERKSRLLYGVLEEHYLAYRWYTTMGARLNFLLSQIMGIFVGWLENIGKVRRNEYSVLSLFVIMYTDAAEFIYKMYWEYLVIWNRQKALKKLGRSLFDVLKFSLILTPIIFYTGSLYLLLFLYLIFKNSIKQVYIKLPFNWLKKKYLNFSLNVSLGFNVLFRDLNTGLSIFDQLYIWFYKLCALTQRNLYFIHGAFILGYREKGLICGFNKVLHLFKLQYKAFMEQKQAVSLRNILDDIKSRFALLSEVKSNMAIKFRILLVLMDADRKILRFRKRCVIALYQYIIKPIFKVDFELFHKLYIENTVLLKRYYTIYWENLYMLMDIVWKLNFFEFIKLFIKWIFIILTMPFRFVINHQKWKYITNYKQGIQGFRDNPMRIIINRPRKKKGLKSKITFFINA